MFPQRLVGFNSSVTSPACTTCHCHPVVVVAVVRKSLGLFYTPLRFTHTHTHTHTHVCVALFLCLQMRGQCFTDTHRVLHYCRPTDSGEGQRFTDRCIHSRTRPTHRAWQRPLHRHVSVSISRLYTRPTQRPVNTDVQKMQNSQRCTLYKV